MSYVQGFVIAVPTAKKEAYREMAAAAAPFFMKHGATRIVEAWGEDVPEGKVTDFRRAVQATPDETVVFAWILWPDRETCDAAAKAMQDDPDMKMPDDMPFDGKRMIWGGFSPIFEAGA